MKRNFRFLVAVAIAIFFCNSFTPQAYAGDTTKKKVVRAVEKFGEKHFPKTTKVVKKVLPKKKS